MSMSQTMPSAPPRASKSTRGDRGRPAPSRRMLAAMRRWSFNALVVLVVLSCFARIQAPALAQPPPPAAAAATRPPSIYFDAPRPTANATYGALGNAFLADGQAAKLLARSSPICR